MESILTTVKKILGLSEDYTAFDTDIVTAINTAFFALWQLGVGNDTSQPFKIEDKTAVWSDFIDSGKMEMCKSYICLRARILFDPPTSPTLMDALNAQCREYEFRMTVGNDMYRAQS